MSPQKSHQKSKSATGTAAVNDNSKSPKEAAAEEAETGRNIDLEIRECRDHGYKLYDKFLGEGAYAKVFAGEPTLERIKQNRRLRDMHRERKDFQVK